MIRELGLRCGDWMEYDGNYVQITMLEVLGGDYIQVNKPYSSATGPIFKDPETYTPEGHPFRDYHDLHPVPLNETILKQFEFENGERNFKGLCLKSRKLESGELVCDFYFTTGCILSDLKYVHEIQHILTDFMLDTKWAIITK